MKTLKKYLIFCLISVVAFLIPTISKADTLKNVEWKYTEDAAKFPNENVDLLNNLYEYINDRTFYTTYSSYKVDKYVVVWDFHHLSENYIVGVFLNSSTINTYYVNSPSNKDYNMYSANQSNKINISSNTITIKFNFNENKLITGYEATELSYNNVSVSSWSMFFSSNALYNDTYISYLDLYVDTHFIQNSDAFGYVKISSWFEDANLKLKIGSKTFSTDEHVPIKTFFDYLEDSSYSYDPILKGSYETNQFTYIIKDFEKGSNKKLKFSFVFEGKVSSVDIKRYVNYNDNFLQGGVKCTYDGLAFTNCVYDFKYDINSDRGITMFFEFDKRMKFKFYDEDSSSKNSFFETTSENISKYSVYRELDLTNKRGVVFYTADSRYMKFIPIDTKFNFYSSIEYCNINISHSSCNFNDLEIGNFAGVSYSNTFLVYDITTNKYSIPSSSVFNVVSPQINSSILFEYDLSKIKDNLYSSFVVINNNVVDSVDDNTNNPNVVLKYNSSLFTYNYINTQTFISDGVTSKKNIIQPGTSIDIVDSDGSSNSSIISDTDVGYDLFTDVDISSYYNDSLNYFKDKIIEFLDLISSMFNSFPSKIKYFYVLIFMFVCGFIIIKLIL